MTPFAKTIVTVLATALLVPPAVAESLIPPPDAPRQAYYIEFGDAMPVSGQSPGMVLPLPAGAPQAQGNHAVTASTSGAMAGVPAAMAATVPSPVPTAIASSPVAPHSPAPSLMDPSAHVMGLETSGMAVDPQPMWAGGWPHSGGELGDASCDDVACPTCPVWAHRSSIFASLLYLRPRNLDVAYAVPIDGPIDPDPASYPLQIGGVGVVDHDYETGWDAGFNLAVNSMTSIYAQVMMLDASTSASTRTAAPNVLRSLVAHPASTSAATDFLSASADLDFDIETVGVGLRHLLVGGDVFAVNYQLGARYGHLEQSFDAVFVNNGTERVTTDIDFEGGGPSLGWDAERRACNCGLRLYTRGAASFLAGRFRGKYFQGQSFDPTVVDTHWEAGRVVPVLDLEIGAGWISRGGRLRLSTGYMVSAWFNTLQTDDFIRAVQANNFDDLGDTLTLDGLRAEAEWRF